MQEVRIKIPRAQKEEIANIVSGNIGISPKEAKRRFEKIDNLLFGIIASVVISGIAVVVAVIGLFVDQMRYNNAAYKEYSTKIDSMEKVQRINNEILDQNKKNQQLIIDLQKQILKK